MNLNYQRNEKKKNKERRAKYGGFWEVWSFQTGSHRQQKRNSLGTTILTLETQRNLYKLFDLLFAPVYLPPQGPIEKV